MGRNSDWSVVGLSADPTPGNVWGVRTVATGYQTIASAADTAHTVLSRVKSTGTSTVWAGDAAEVFRDNLGDFPDHVKKCADSFALAATAVSSWASTMDLAQDKADRGLAKAELAQADLEAAQAALASAESLAADAASSLEDKQDLYDLYKNSTPPAGVTVPTSYQLTQLRTQRNGANSGVSTASGDVADAQARLDAAKALVLEALEDYEAGASTLKGSIDDAKDAGVEADSFWEAVFNSEAWAVLIVVLTVVAIVLAVAAFFVTGPLALILAVASVVVGAVMMANDIMAFLNGDMSPLEFAIAIALSVIPGGALAKAGMRSVRAASRSADAVSDGASTLIRRSADTGEALPSSSVRFTQRTVSYNKIDRATGDAYNYDDIVSSMRRNGWDGEPIDVVRMRDGGMTSMDNTRVAAAREADIDVRAQVHDADQPLTSSQADRFGTRRNPNPGTWGDAADARIDKQGSSFAQQNPFGSHDVPRITGRPE